jgi:hypothetical protein
MLFLYRQVARMHMPLLLAAALVSTAVGAKAEPGLATKVRGATVDPGFSEIEIKYGRLAGKELDGLEAIDIEFSHGFNRHFEGGIALEFEREPGGRRRLTGGAVEAAFALGRVDALDLDIALFGEYELTRYGADAVEAKLLLQRRKGPFDARFNLIAEKELERGERIEWEYAASAVWKAVGDLRLGVEAFGELGTTRDFLPRAEHFAGPVLKVDVEGLPGKGELEIQTGYLFALGAARDGSDGQFRLILEYGFRL